MITKFWNTLFNDGEEICIADTIYDTTTFVYKEKAYPKDWQDNYREFFCINPLTTSRLDDRVTCFRNILVEIDNMPSVDQMGYIADLGMPVSTCTFSGNKSMHFIISLKEPCKDKQEYKKLVKRIYDKVGHADKSTSNPSRLSRTPNAIRSNGVHQTLQWVNKRVSRETLEAWLGPNLKTEDYNTIIKMPKQTGEGRRRLLPVRVLAFMEYGAQEGGRNRALFINACELFRANYEKEEIFAIAQKVLDLPVTEMRQCIESARKAVANEN